MAERGVLERPSARLKVIRALATGEHTVAELARQFGVTAQSMGEFKQRHSDRIASVAADLANEFAGIEFADKAARVAELSADVAMIAELLADPATTARSGVQLAEMLRVKQSALRAISEELGQLPARMNVVHSGSLDLQINGVALDDLK